MRNHFQSPDEIDTDTEIEYEDDYEYETRSKCEYPMAPSSDDFDSEARCYDVVVRLCDWLISLALPASYVTDQDDVLYEEKSDRAMMRQLPPEDRAKIQTQVEEFRMEKVTYPPRPGCSVLQLCPPCWTPRVGREPLCYAFCRSNSTARSPNGTIQRTTLWCWPNRCA